mgnify:CR=1 FL=1
MKKLFALLLVSALVSPAFAADEKKAEPAKKAVAKKVPAKKTATKPAVRQKHFGADGEVKFLEHRNLFIGFFGGKVVVTKRTQEQCLEVLRNEYKLEV